jgi:tetratricopeptide (TPR) repeat protein
MRRVTICLIFLIILQLFFSCKSMAPVGKVTINDARDALIIGGEEGKTAAAPDGSFDDISPASLKIPLLKLHPTKSENEEIYFTNLNKAIDFMNSKNYAAASEILKKMITEYKDHGRCLYNLGLCYYNLKKRSDALTCLSTAYAMGNRLSVDLIGHICFEIGYEYLENKNWTEAIRYLKIAPAIKATSENILYCYYQLALSLPLPKQTVMLLYAGRYMIQNRVKSDNVIVIGQMLGQQLMDETASPYLEDGLEILRYANTVKNDAYIHQYLGFLYIYRRELSKAESEFRAALAAGISDKEQQTFINEKLIELKPLTYTYTREWPFTLTLKSGSLESCSIEVLYTLPLTTVDQKVSDIQVSLNDKGMEYEIVRDKNDTPLLKVQLKNYLREGENKVVIQARVWRAPQWFGKQVLADVKKSGYDRSSPLYKAYTASNNVFNTAHPLVKAARQSLYRYLKQDNVELVARAVYDYVIRKMSYKFYNSSGRPRTTILNRLRANGCVGLCEDYTVLTVSILRSFGIPCVYLAGPKYQSDIGHAWPAIWLPGFKNFVVIDTTWGDGNLPDFYFLFNTNLTVIDIPMLESDIMVKGQTSMYVASANVKIEIKKESTSLTR